MNNWEQFNHFKSIFDVKCVLDELVLLCVIEVATSPSIINNLNDVEFKNKIDANLDQNFRTKMVLLACMLCFGLFIHW